MCLVLVGWCRADKATWSASSSCRTSWGDSHSMPGKIYSPHVSILESMLRGQKLHGESCFVWGEKKCRKTIGNTQSLLRPSLVDQLLPGRIFLLLMKKEKHVLVEMNMITNTSPPIQMCKLYLHPMDLFLLCKDLTCNDFQWTMEHSLPTVRGTRAWKVFGNELTQMLLCWTVRQAY